MILQVNVTASELRRIKDLTGERDPADAMAALATLAGNGRIGRVSVPNAATKRSLRANERDEKAGKISPAFKSGRAGMEWLERQ